MFTMYIFMYDNVVFEITCEIRLMFDFTRVDTQVTLVASAQLERAACSICRYVPGVGFLCQNCNY